MPIPGPGEILVKISHSGICHSDLHIMLGDWPWLKVTDGQIGGHEGKKEEEKRERGERGRGGGGKIRTKPYIQSLHLNR